MNKQLNIFSLHGSYFENNENRLTANFLFLLSEFRHTLLPSLFQKLRCPGPALLDFAAAKFRFQCGIVIDGCVKIPDGDIRFGDSLRVVFEAKVGANPLQLPQLLAYAKELRDCGTETKRLVCITQDNQRQNFEAIRGAIEPAILPQGSLCYVRWYELMDIIRQCFSLSSPATRLVEKRVHSGKPVVYGQRLCSLFLEEVAREMYDKKIIDEIISDDLADIVLSTQTSWFMRAAREFRVWFPSSASARPKPAKYVAYYETNDGNNENPRSIRYIAQNKAWWNQLTLEDAAREVELRHLTSNREMMAEISKWKEGFFNVVLTDDPIQLIRPIPLGQKDWAARTLPLRKVDLPQFVNAKSLDDLV